MTDRTRFYRTADFTGKTVLDIGCNLGQMSFWAADQGATEVLGVEYDETAFLKALELKAKGSYKQVIFKLDDIDLPTFWGHVPVHDTSLFLSIIDTKELENKYGDLAKVCMRTREVMYYEGHTGQSHLCHWGNLFNYTDFSRFEYLGDVEGRPLFRCSRQILNSDEFVSSIKEMAARYDRIAVIGNQLAGKSTLMEKVGAIEGFSMIDDCDDMGRLLREKKLIFSDYRAALYLDDFELLYNVISPPNTFEVKRDLLRYTRSSALRHNRLRSYLTVRAY